MFLIVKLWICSYFFNTLFKLIHFDALVLPASEDEYPGKIIINYSKDIEIFGTQNTLFNKTKEGQYEIKKTVSNKGLIVLLYVGVRNARWKAIYEGNITKREPFGTLYAEFYVNEFFKGGNNKIKYYNVENNNAKKLMVEI